MGPVGGHGVERVRHVQDASAERHPLGCQAERVAAAIRALVVEPHHQGGTTQRADPADDLGTDHRVLAQRALLFA